MFSPKKRREEILNKLATKGTLYIHDIAKEFGVSEVTIRRDLIVLEKEGKIDRDRGWVYPSSISKLERSFEERKKERNKQKIAIAKEAKKLLSPGFVVFLDAGTTTFELAKILGDIDYELTIITNSLVIFDTISRFLRIKSYLTGGELDKRNFSLVGTLAVQSVEQFFADIAFLGATAIDPEKGVFTVDTLGAQISRMMAKNSKETIILADSTKFSKSAPIRVISMEEVDMIITDGELGEDIKEKVRSKEVELRCIEV